MSSKQSVVRGKSLKFVSIRNELTADFKALFLPTQLTNGPTEVSKSFILDMSFKEEEKTIESPYLVHHVMQKSSGNDELDAWARSKKLFPWVAVGAPLKVSSSDQPHTCINARDLYTLCLVVRLDTN